MIKRYYVSPREWPCFAVIYIEKENALVGHFVFPNLEICKKERRAVCENHYVSNASVRVISIGEVAVAAQLTHVPLIVLFSDCTQKM